MNILVTGATGAIGLPLTKHLLRRHRVTVLTEVPESPPARQLELLGARLVFGRLPDELPSDGTFKNLDALIHLAAYIGLSLTAQIHRQVNLEGTRAILRKIEPSTHLIFTSTALVHGPSSDPLTEASPPNPLDSYTHSKWQAEQAIRKAHRDVGQRYTILRPAFIVTPKPSGLRQKFLKLAILPFLPLPGGGTNRLPFLSYKDIIRAIDLVLKKGPLNDALLITHHTPLPLRNMFELPTGKCPLIIPLPIWIATPLPPYLRALLTQDWRFTSRKAARRLGWFPQHHPMTHRRQKRQDLFQPRSRRQK